MLAVVESLVRYAALPVSAQPNAGQPRKVGHRRFEFSIDPSYFARYLRRFAEAGAVMVGGCCGTTPTHIEAAVADVITVPGGFQVTGVPQRQVMWREVAATAYAGGHALPAGDTPGLEASVYFQPDTEVWTFGAIVCALRVEAETGRLVIERLVWVDDAGTVINPLLAEGQLHGSLAQGLGQALQEAIVYDRDGQLVTGTLMDYALPRADEVPYVIIEKTCTPSPRNPLGAKGVGEAGCIGMPPAVVNAAVDALSPFGVTHLDMPLTPARIWSALRNARS